MITKPSGPRALSPLAAVLCTTLVALQGPAALRTTPANVDWPVYRGDPKGNQYSPLAQIHAANVHRLSRAWEYQHRRRQPALDDARQPDRGQRRDVRHDAEPEGRGAERRDRREIWAFDPAKHNNGNVVRLRNRGVTYWKGAEGERIFHFVRDRVYALDAKSGALITSFGKNGFIDLRQNLGVDPARRSSR